MDDPDSIRVRFNPAQVGFIQAKQSPEQGQNPFAQTTIALRRWWNQQPCVAANCINLNYAKTVKKRGRNLIGAAVEKEKIARLAVLFKRGIVKSEEILVHINRFHKEIFDAFRKYLGSFLGNFLRVLSVRKSLLCECNFSFFIDLTG